MQHGIFITLVIVLLAICIYEQSVEIKKLKNRLRRVSILKRKHVR